MLPEAATTGIGDAGQSAPDMIVAGQPPLGAWPRHIDLRHPGLEPGSRFLMRGRTAGPRLRARVTAELHRIARGSGLATPGGAGVTLPRAARFADD
jgi:hypothetical protein